MVERMRYHIHDLVGAVEEMAEWGDRQSSLNKWLITKAVGVNTTERQAMLGEEAEAKEALGRVRRHLTELKEWKAELTQEELEKVHGFNTQGASW
jgi:hypothetical protein